MKFPRISKRKKIVIFLLLILLFLLYNFPFLFYPHINPYISIKDQSPIFLEDKALFISDVHFTGDPMDLGTYLDSAAIEYLIIIGDLFDSPDIYYEFGIQNTLRLLNLDAYSGQIYFMWGPPHDPLFNISAANFQTLGHFGFFTTNHYTILAHHGVHRSRFGSFAFITNYFISYPLLEQLWRKRSGIPENIWVIFGHSHIAKLNPNLKIANCGGFKDIPLFHPQLGEGILVDDSIQLVTIPF